MLREQLEQANESNANMNADLRSVSEDLKACRDEFAKKETEWKEEQEVRVYIAIQVKQLLQYFYNDPHSHPCGL